MEEDIPEFLDESVLPELKAVNMLAAFCVKPKVQFNRMSHCRKLLRAWVYVRRYLTPKRQQPLRSLITADEMPQAENSVLLMLQVELFDDLFKIQQRTPGKRHSLSNLVPFVAEDGLIRLGGRLKYSAIPYDGIKPSAPAQETSPNNYSYPTAP